VRKPRALGATVLRGPDGRVLGPEGEMVTLESVSKMVATAGRPARTHLQVDRILPAYAQVATQLRELIVTGQLHAGDQLPTEAELATVFGVSRSTIREALRSLSAQNLVYTSRGVTGGTFVSEVDPNTVSDYLRTSLGLMSGSETVSVADLLEARAALEVPAARFAALRRSNPQLEQLGHNVEVGHIEDEAVRFEKNTEFHALILEASGNRLLSIVASPIFEVLRSRFRRDDVPNDYWQSVDADHREIYQHLIAGDAEAAENSMRAHLDRLESTYESIDIVSGRSH
jgi:GntR family transcriptional repressor for pyruvate dehydrogenase complex